MILPLDPVSRFPACLSQLRLVVALAPQTMMRAGRRCRVSVCRSTWTSRRSAGPGGSCLRADTTLTTAKAPVRFLWVRTWGPPTTPRSSPSSTPSNWTKASRRPAACLTSSSALTCCTLTTMRTWFWSSMMIWWPAAAAVTDQPHSQIWTGLLWQDGIVKYVNRYQILIYGGAWVGCL